MYKKLFLSVLVLVIAGFSFHHLATAATSGNSYPTSANSPGGMNLRLSTNVNPTENGNFTLSWSSTYMPSPDEDVSCQITGGNLNQGITMGPFGFSGSASQTISANTTYYLSCNVFGPGLQFGDNVALNVRYEPEQVITPSASISGISPASNYTYPTANGGSQDISGTFNWSNANYDVSFEIVVTKTNNQGTTYQTLTSFNGPSQQYPPTALEPYSYSSSYTFGPSTTQTGTTTYSIRYHGLAKSNSQSLGSEPDYTRTVIVPPPPPINPPQQGTYTIKVKGPPGSSWTTNGGAHSQPQGDNSSYYPDQQELSTSQGVTIIPQGVPDGWAASLDYTICNNGVCGLQQRAWGSLSQSGFNGGDVMSVNIVWWPNVQQSSSVSFSANPTTITQGNSSTLTWTSSNAQTCRGTSSPSYPGWANASKTLSGTENVAPSQNTTFTMTCGDASAAATVNVVSGASKVNISTNSTTTGQYIQECSLGDANDCDYYMLPQIVPGQTFQQSVQPNTTYGSFYRVVGGNIGGKQLTYFNSRTGASQDFTLFTGLSADVSFVYTNVGGFDYTLSNSGNPTVKKGNNNTTVYGQTVVTATATSGSPQPVSFAVSGLPNGASVYGITPASCTPNPSCSSVISFAVTSNTPAGRKAITVTGTPNNRTTVFDLVVNTSERLDVTCSAGSGTGVLGQPVTWTANVSGGEPPYRYMWSGPGIPTTPAPSTNPYTVTYSTVGNKTATVQVTDSENSIGTCPAGQVKINFTPKFEEF